MGTAINHHVLDRVKPSNGTTMRVERWGETDNQATAPFVLVRWIADKTHAKKILTASHLEN